jgi:site-specific DNA-cytosine methylase
MRKVFRRIPVLGISAGQGALLYPFMNKEGFKVLGNIESRGVFHTTGEEQWKLNFGDIPFTKGDYIEGIKPQLIVSSPDCGASSVMRLSKVKKLGHPEENESLNLVINGIIKYLPTVFVIENLPRLMSLIPRYFFEQTFWSYDIIIHEVSVKEFGNSQVSRKRLIIIGVKKGVSRGLKNHLERIYSLKELKFTRGCLKPAQFKGNYINYMPPLNKTLAMYDYRKLPEKKNLTVKQIHKLWNTDFKDEKKWPIKTAKMSTLPGVYKLDPDKYPLTVRPSDRQFRPDGYPLGTEDYKSIMGFPEEYKIYMDDSTPKEYLYWLNKSRYTLCKGSVYEVGQWLYETLLPFIKLD